MPVMGFIACRMFEDEIVHIIENEPAINRVIVVENEDCPGLIEKLEIVDREYDLLPLPELSITSDGDGGSITLIVYMLELALHADPDNLKEVVYERTREMSQYADGILLFYGLCGNVLGKVEKDFESDPCTVRILKDENGDVVDDCIGAVLGGRAAYLEKLKGCKR